MTDVFKPAKNYIINAVKVPDLDRCWSACNGIDGFGHADQQISDIREKYGECLDKLPVGPRLIIYRRRKNDDLEVKLWTTRSLCCDDDDDRLVMASLAKAIVAVGADAAFINIELIDWAPGTKGDFEGRCELSIEFCSHYSHFFALQCLYKKFFKVFDHGKWK